jgi:hypothetical protein
MVAASLVGLLFVGLSLHLRMVVSAPTFGDRRQRP